MEAERSRRLLHFALCEFDSSGPASAPAQNRTLSMPRDQPDKPEVESEREPIHLFSVFVLVVAVILGLLIVWGRIQSQRLH